MAQVATLSTLLSDSWNFYQKNMTAIVIASVVVGLIVGFFGLYAQQKIGSSMGINMDRMEDVMDGMRDGDEGALKELEAMGNALEEQFGGTQAQQMQAMMGYAKGALPFVGLTAIIGFLVSVAFYAFMLLLVVEQKDTAATANRTAGMFLPLLGLYLWIFIRSFVWIPFLGIIVAIILGPRFVLSPLILVKEKKGVFESATLSYKRTSGYWGKIVGNMIVAGGLLWIVMAVVTMVLSMGGFSVTTVVGAVAKQLVMAYFIIFATLLAAAILKGGKKA